MISSGGEYVLIDTGANATAVVDHLEEYEISRLEYLIITNLESCHAGGLRALAASDIEIGTLIIPDAQSYASVAIRRAITSIESNSDVIRIGIGDEDFAFNFGDGKFTLFAPSVLRAEDHLASYSLVTSVEVAGKHVLFMSDVTEENLSAMIENSSILKTDVITVPTHGRQDVFSDELLTAISPKVAIIMPITSLDTTDEVLVTTQKLLSNGITVANAMDDVVTLKINDGILILE